MKKSPAEERESLKLKEQQSPLSNLNDQINQNHTSGTGRLGDMSWQWTGILILILVVLIALGYFIFK